MQVSSKIREFNARESEKTTKSIKRSLTKTEILRLILNIIVVIFVLFPIIYAFVMSVKPSHELYLSLIHI